MIQRCFDTPVARCFWTELRKFSGRVHTGRWGTVAFCAVELLDRERPLRHFWSRALYESGADGGGDDPEADGDSTARISIVDAAIRSPFFWAALRAMDVLFGVIRTAPLRVLAQIFSYVSFPFSKLMSKTYAGGK